MNNKRKQPVADPETTSYTVRLSTEMLRALKDQHAEGFHGHRLSFNAWILRTIIAGCLSQPPKKRVRKHHRIGEEHHD